MKLPNLEKSLTKRAGSLESLWKLVQGKGSDSFTIHEAPYLPFSVEAHWHDSNRVVWAFFCKEVNGDTVMDPLVKYRLMRTAEGGLDFTPFYRETFPFPPCRVIEGESDLREGTIRREELEELVRDWDVEFGNRGYVEKTPPLPVSLSGGAGSHKLQVN
jgi:hypothetical protein